MRFKEKVLRDPLHGNINITHPLLLELIDSRPFQRLRRIRQLGMCFSVFHGAEHSRFQHSIGTMWLMHRILKNWIDNKLLKIDKKTQLTVEAAALLHDIGHGPFSHALEHSFSQVDHENLGYNIVKIFFDPILKKHDLETTEVVSVMQGKHPEPIYHELLSSQLDVDRMDYLLRDSLYTGTKYGLFDLDRIIYTIKPFKDNDSYCCAVDRKGCEAVEGYLFCRYFMHWQVYLHKTVRSYETLLRVILQRARLIYKQAPYAIMIPRNLNFLFENKGDKLDQNFLENYLNIDDFDFYHTLKLWANGNDKILTDLCNRFLYRHPFKTFDDPGKDKVKRIREYIEKQEGEDAQWYFHIDTPQNQGYDIYQPGSSKAPIRILDYPPNSWQEISRASRTKAIEALSEPVSRRLIMIPRKHYENIKSWL